MMRIVTGDEIRIESGKNSAETHLFINDKEVEVLYPLSIVYDGKGPPTITMRYQRSANVIRQVRAFLVEGNDMITFEDWLRNRKRG